MKHVLKRFRHWMYYSPPGALSTSGWDSFDKEFRKCAPVRYWITRSFLRRFVYRIRHMFRDASSWIQYRTTDRQHIVNTGLQPGYHGPNERMLYANFSLLVDFVEIDQARHYYNYNLLAREKRSWKEKYLPFYRIFVSFRSPTHGIAYLAWATSLDDPLLSPAAQSPDQASVAREISYLYNWWVNVRPNRKEIKIPYYVPPRRNRGSGKTVDKDKDAEDYAKFRAAIDEQGDLDKTWLNEDTEMLGRLIAIRNDLWV